MATAERPDSGSLRRLLGFALLTFAATAFVFRGAFDADFVNWDDPLNVTANRAFRGFTPEHLRWMFTTFLAGHWMPLTWLSLALDHAFWGLDPAGFHTTNVVLHALVAVLVLALFAELLEQAAPDTDDRWRAAAACFGALLFALHPLRAESVAWVTERRDVLSSVFLCAAVLVWLRAARRAGEHRIQVRAWVLALVLYALSLASKSMGITLPGVLFVLSLWLGRWSGAGRRAVLVELAPFVALAGLVGAIALFGQAEGTNELADLAQFGWSQRLAVSGYALAFYPWKTFAPSQLSPLYELDRGLDPTAATYLVPGLFVLALTAVLLLRARRWPGLASGWLIYGIVAAPLIGLVQTGRQLVADRYSYLACLPFALLVAWAFLWVVMHRRTTRWVTLATATLLVVAAAFTTQVQVAVWNNSVTLWSSAAEVDPTSQTAWLNLGVGHHQANDLEAALAAYDRAADLGPDAEVHYNRALSLLTLEREPEAWDDLNAALDLAPAHIPALEVVRELDRRAGRADRALGRLRTACTTVPAQAGPRLLLAALQRDLGQAEESSNTLREALAAEPEFAPAHHAWALMSSATDTAEGLRSIERAIQLDPFTVRYRIDHGRLLRAAGRDTDARRAFKDALRFEPGNPEAEAELRRS